MNVVALLKINIARSNVFVIRQVMIDVSGDVVAILGQQRVVVAVCVWVPGGVHSGYISKYAQAPLDENQLFGMIGPPMSERSAGCCSWNSMGTMIMYGQAAGLPKPG